MLCFAGVSGGAVVQMSRLGVGPQGGMGGVGGYPDGSDTSSGEGEPSVRFSEPITGEAMEGDGG